jgi:hypothetical protein
VARISAEELMKAGAQVSDDVEEKSQPELLKSG